MTLDLHKLESGTAVAVLRPTDVRATVQEVLRARLFLPRAASARGQPAAARPGAALRAAPRRLCPTTHPLIRCFLRRFCAAAAGVAVGGAGRAGAAEHELRPNLPLGADAGARGGLPAPSLCSRVPPALSWTASHSSAPPAERPAPFPPPPQTDKEKLSSLALALLTLVAHLSCEAHRVRASASGSSGSEGGGGEGSGASSEGPAGAAPPGEQAAAPPPQPEPLAPPPLPPGVRCPADAGVDGAVGAPGGGPGTAAPHIRLRFCSPNLTLSVTSPELPHDDSQLEPELHNVIRRHAAVCRGRGDQALRYANGLCEVLMGPEEWVQVAPAGGGGGGGEGEAEGGETPGCAARGSASFVCSLPPRSLSERRLAAAATAARCPAGGFVRAAAAPPCFRFDFSLFLACVSPPCAPRLFLPLCRQTSPCCLIEIENTALFHLQGDRGHLPRAPASGGGRAAPRPAGRRLPQRQQQRRRLGLAAVAPVAAVAAQRRSGAAGRRPPGGAAAPPAGAAAAVRRAHAGAHQRPVAPPQAPRLPLRRDGPLPVAPPVAAAERRRPGGGRRRRRRRRAPRQLQGRQQRQRQQPDGVAASPRGLLRRRLRHRRRYRRRQRPPVRPGQRGSHHPAPVRGGAGGVVQKLGRPG